MRMLLLALLIGAAAVRANGLPEPGMATPPPGHSLLGEIGSESLDLVLRVNGVSEAGIAALRGEPVALSDPERLRGARCAVERAAAATPFDVNAYARALEASDALAAGEARRRHAVLVSALRKLTPEDAAILLHLVGTGDQPRGFGPPPGGARPGDPQGGPPPGPPSGMAPDRRSC